MPQLITEKYYIAPNLLQNLLVKPIITPRFALSCDMKLMQELAKIAKVKDLHIQVFFYAHVICVNNVQYYI